MTRDELIALGLSEEQAQAVAAEFDGMNARIAEAEQTRVENDRLTAEIDNLTAQMILRDKRDAVMAALPGFMPRDARLILRLIDLEKITIDEGEAQGLDAQVQALKADAPYLFLDAPDPVGGTAASGMQADHFDMNTFLRGEN